MSLRLHIGFLDIGPEDFVDIALVAVLLYQAYQLIKGTMAVRAFIGFLLLYLVYLLVKATGMELLTAILGRFMEVGVLAAIVLFQQEIRKFLFFVGSTTTPHGQSFLRRLPWGKKTPKADLDITPIVEAAKTLAGSNTGALIVLANEDNLKFYEESGDPINAVISKRLLIAIFNAHSPLHDGGVIIRKGQIIAARCILPVTEQPDLPPQWGLRHRAAIGMSELSNTLVLVVSEETGQISVARNGKLFPNLSTQEIRAALKTYLQ